MSAEQNARVVHECIEAVLSGDWAGIRRAHAGDAVIVDPLLPDPISGIDAILELYQGCREQEPDM